MERRPHLSREATTIGGMDAVLAAAVRDARDPDVAAWFGRLAKDGEDEKFGSESDQKQVCRDQQRRRRLRRETTAAAAEKGDPSRTTREQILASTGVYRP